jgi:SOS-response transcriptional repressor LexA
MIEGINERFAIIRKDNGLNVKEFAASLDMEPTTVSSIESGKREPSKEVLLNLAIKYAVSLNWIFTGVGEKRLTKAVMPDQDKHPILSDLENLIDEKTRRYGFAISNMESRISTLENRLIAASETDEVIYPFKNGSMDSSTTDSMHKHLDYQYVADPEPEYEAHTGTVDYYDDIAAGPPMRQSADNDRVVDVPHRLIKTKAADYYALRVQGNSMIDACIPDGSMVLIRKSDVPQHGIIQVVWIDGRVTLKRMREGEDHGWTLCYEDGSGRTIPLGEENMVQGDFVAVLPPYTKPQMRGE